MLTTSTDAHEKAANIGRHPPLSELLAAAFHPPALGKHERCRVTPAVVPGLTLGGQQAVRQRVVQRPGYAFGVEPAEIRRSSTGCARLRQGRTPSACPFW